MKNISILGAGLSSTDLIKYLRERAAKYEWTIHLYDTNAELVNGHLHGSDRMVPHVDNVLQEDRLDVMASGSDLVISMLPARFHPQVLQACLRHSTDLITPSYQSDEMIQAREEIESKGMVVLNEVGLDPGIDHMSGMKLIDHAVAQGYKPQIFESFTGGLVAPGYDDNPWRYKFTWNPRNVVLAGQGGAAKFIQQGNYKYIPYHKLFRRTEFIDLGELGMFEGYANRDSLRYRDLYGLEDIPTFYRGTLRRKGFCRAWDVFVQLGLTDDTYVVTGSENMTYRDFLNSFLAYNPHDSVELKLRHYLGIHQDDELWDKIVYCGLFEDKRVGLKDATPAQILQKALEEKWSLEPEDKDMIVMWHKLVYQVGDRFEEINSTLVVEGELPPHTAMSKTVGLPVAICAKMILNGELERKGLLLPFIPEIYEPALAELEEFDIVFQERFVDPPMMY